MQQMTKYEIDRKIDWLGRYLTARRKAQLAEFAVEEARAAAARTTPVLDGLPRPSGHSDKVARAAERLAAAESACRAAVADSRQVRAEVEWSISTVGDAVQRELLRRRYLMGQSLTEIAEQMHIEYRWLRRLHRRAAGQAVTRFPPVQGAGDSGCSGGRI